MIAQVTVNTNIALDFNYYYDVSLIDRYTHSVLREDNPKNAMELNLKIRLPCKCLKIYFNYIFYLYKFNYNKK